MITNLKPNCVSTVNFDGKFPGMRKPQSFTVYPVRSADETVKAQSENYWAEIDLSTGDVKMSARTAQHANSTWLMLCEVRGTAKYFKLSSEQLKPLAEWVVSNLNPSGQVTIQL